LVSRMDGELGNLRAALRWLIGHAEAARAQRLSGAARTLWIQRPYLTEGRRWPEEAIALDPAPGPPRDLAEARAKAHVGLIGSRAASGRSRGRRGGRARRPAPVRGAE
jgi:hypothetical protein